MDTVTFSIFRFSIVVFLLTGIIIFVFFRLFRYLMQFVRLSPGRILFLTKYLPLAELSTWILFLLWSIQYFATRGQLITLVPLLVFVIIILYLAWFALKDITAGVIFKTGKTHQLNDHISVAGIQGVIHAMGMRNLEVEDPEGRMIQIPYSRVVGNIMLKSYTSQSLLSHNFILQLPLQKDTDIFQIMESIRLSILSMPWASQKNEPRISILDENPEQAELRITLFSLDTSYFKKTEKLLEKEYQARVK